LRKEIYAKYSIELATKICDIDPSVPWSILGVGPFSTGSENQQSEPVFDVVVAPIRGEKPNLNEAITRQFPIGCIEFFQLRRSWFRGDLSEEHFRSNSVAEAYVQFDTGKYDIVPLGHLWEGEFENEAIDTLKGVKYLTFDGLIRRKQVRLAVPCSEILRFYYSPSSNFVSATLSGKTAREAIFNPENREAAQRKADKRGFDCVTLRKSIEDLCAPYVGRLALCGYAEKSFDSIFPLTQANPLENPGRYLICRPPLNQKTSWDIDGIQIGDTFFVTRIKRCFGDFPFKQILFDRDNNRMGNRKKEPKETKVIKKKEPVFNEGEEENKNGGGANDDAGDNESNKPLLDDTPAPSIYVDPVQLEILDGNPIFSYLDLEDVGVQKVIKATILNEDIKTITIYDGTQIIDKLTTTAASGGLGNKNIGQLKLIRLRRNEGQEHDFTIYDVMAELESILLEEETGDVSLYYLNGEVHSELEFATVVPFGDYKNEKLCFVSESDKANYFAKDLGEKFNSRYLRPMVCYRITYMETYYYFLEFLSANGLSADNTSSLFFSNFSHDEPNELIENEIKKFDEFGSRWKSSTVRSAPEPSSLFAHRFVHRKNTDIEKKVALIFKELKRGHDLLETNN